MGKSQDCNNQPRLALLLLLLLFAGCGKTPDMGQNTLTVTDQLGRTVRVPAKAERVAAMHHFGGQIIYALGAQDKLVEQALYGLEGKAREAVDPEFAAMPNLLEGHSFNAEGLVALKPQIAFVYASFDQSEMDLLENAGISTVAVRGETIEESFDAVYLIARVLGLTSRAEAYIADCRQLLAMVAKRIGDIPRAKRLKVMFTGPKGVYSVATGEMLQTEILSLAGAINVAEALKGFWGNVSPEQVALWNPDVIFIGSSLKTYGLSEIYGNTHFQTVSAIRQKRVYVFPSNIGWWDYPAPRCVLGVVWAAKALYPKRFADIDMLTTANRFYRAYTGFTFSEMGGRLP